MGHAGFISSTLIMELRVEGLGFGDSGFKVGVEDLGLKAQSLGLRV